MSNRPLRFAAAKERGTVIEKSGYHQPDGRRFQSRTCGCRKTTDKGAYRDVIVDMDGWTVYFYHQSPVVVEDGGTYRLDSHGYKTSTTKERLNRWTPSGYFVRQEDFVWYLETPNGRREFNDGMTVDTQED